MTMTTATKTKQRTRKAAQPIPEKIVNNAPKLHEDFPVGAVSHQGDLIFVRIENLPKSAKPRLNQQLADGNTQGSRHILTPHAKAFDCDLAEVQKSIKTATKCDVGESLIGPVFVSPDNPSAHDVTHPEHGHQGFEAGAVIACVYQRNLDAMQKEQRTRD